MVQAGGGSSSNRSWISMARTWCLISPDGAGNECPTIRTRPCSRSCPDWVCEIQSPGNARYDRVVKLPKYALYGVKHVWLVDTTAKTLEVLRLEDDHWIVAGNYGGGDVVRAGPFDAVELKLASLWVP